MSGSEDKQLKVAAQQLLDCAKDLKENLRRFHYDASVSAMSWADFCSRYSLIRGKVDLLLRCLRAPHMPDLQDRVFVPRKLSTEPDEHLVNVTERRITSFTHQISPELLRTKLAPELDRLFEDLRAATAATFSPSDAADAVAALNEACRVVLEARPADVPMAVPAAKAAVRREPDEEARRIAEALATGEGLAPLL